MARAYLASSRALAVLLVVLGIAMVVSTLARGAAPLALGVVLGVLFTALGVARLWLGQSLRTVETDQPTGRRNTR